MAANGNLSANLAGLLASEFDSEFAGSISQFAQSTPFTGSALAQGSAKAGMLGSVSASGTGETPLSSILQAYLTSLLPAGWFGWLAPVRDVVLGGLADALAASGKLLQVVRAQTRVSTSTGWLLDITAWDFFGIRFRRLPGELDASFRSRVVQEVIQERVTRAGVSSALARLTGRVPVIFEPFSAADCGGGYRLPSLGYGRSGRYGSISYPNQMFITAFRPRIASIPSVPGYGSVQGGYGRAPSAYASLTEVQGPVQDADIVQCVKNNVAAGVVGWLQIQSNQGGGQIITADDNSTQLTDDYNQPITSLN